MIKAKAKISIGQGIPGRDIELRNNITHIQWKYKDEDDTKWKDLISLEELQASEIELQVNDTHIQWRYYFEETWKDLISLEEITPSITHLESAVSDKIKELNNLKNELEENESSRNETFNQKISEVDTAISNANKVTQDTENKLEEITNEYSVLKDDIVKTNEDIKLSEQQRQQAETDRENTFRETIENTNSKIEDLTSLENYVKEEEIKRQEAEINRTNNFNESIKNTNNKIKEADDKIVDVEERMKHIEDNFNGLVDGEGIVTKEYLVNNHYDKKEIDTQMKNKADSNHTHDYLSNNGGKLNSRLDLGENDLVFMDEDSGDIIFLNEDGTIEKARIFISGDNKNPTLNISLYNRSCNFILEKDKLKINGFGDAPIFINDKERLLTDKYTYGQYGTTLQNVDLDTLLVGRYSCFGCPNSPNFNLTQDNNFLLDVFRHDDLWLTQVAYDVRSNNIYVRSKTSNIWGTWDKLVLSSNLYLHNKVEIELLEWN